LLTALEKASFSHSYAKRCPLLNNTERAVRRCTGNKFPVRPPDALLALFPIEIGIPDFVLSSGPAIVVGWKVL
jgi:hypothetical protein